MCPDSIRPLRPYVKRLHIRPAREVQRQQCEQPDEQHAPPSAGKPCPERFAERMRVRFAVRPKLPDEFRDEQCDEPRDPEPAPLRWAAHVGSRTKIVNAPPRIACSKTPIPLSLAPSTLVLPAMPRRGSTSVTNRRRDVACHPRPKKEIQIVTARPKSRQSLSPGGSSDGSRRRSVRDDGDRRGAHPGRVEPSKDTKSAHQLLFDACRAPSR